MWILEVNPLLMLSMIAMVIGGIILVRLYIEEYLVWRKINKEECPWHRTIVGFENERK